MPRYELVYSKMHPHLVRRERETNVFRLKSLSLDKVRSRLSANLPKAAINKNVRRAASCRRFWGGGGESLREDPTLETGLASLQLLDDMQVKSTRLLLLLCRCLWSLLVILALSLLGVAPAVTAATIREHGSYLSSSVRERACDVVLPLPAWSRLWMRGPRVSGEVRKLPADRLGLVDGDDRAGRLHVDTSPTG